MNRYRTTETEARNPLIAAMRRAMEAQDNIAPLPNDALGFQPNIIRLPDLRALRDEITRLSEAVVAGVECASLICQLGPEEVPDCVDIDLLNDAGATVARKLEEVRQLLPECGVAEVPDLFKTARHLSAQMRALGKLRLAAVGAHPLHWLVA